MNYNKAIVEVLEIIKYLDKDIVEYLDQEKLLKLEQEKDLDYKFEINKNIPIYDNDFLPETIEILNNLLKNKDQ